jgi:predicted deacetylase
MKYRVNISIDDVSPHPKASTKVLKMCERLISKFPSVKFSLFVPIAYWRTRRSGVVTKDPLVIWKYPDFCEEIKKLPKENYEICYHGYYHGIPGENDNNEFLDITYDEARKRCRSMKRQVLKAGLQDVFKPIFRPPAWRMGPDAWDALNDEQFELFAVSDIDYALKSYQGKDKQYKSNYSTVFPPFRDLEIKESCGIVYHACEWDRNYLSEEHESDLAEFLQNYIDDIEFVFMENL